MTETIKLYLIKELEAEDDLYFWKAADDKGPIVIASKKKLVFEMDKSYNITGTMEEDHFLATKMETSKPPKKRETELKKVETERQALVLEPEPAKPEFVKASTLVTDTQIGFPTKEELVIAPESRLELNLENVKKYLCPLATDREIYMFMQLCINQKLDPFIKDAYLIKYDSSKPATMVVSKDAFLKKAEQISDYEGFHAGIVVETDGKIERREGSMKLSGENLIGGWAKIYRKGMKVFSSEVGFSEYNKGQSSWKKMPSTMIRKVAIVQALREAFPMSFQGMYDMSEIEIKR